MREKGEVVLEVRNMCKNFGSTIALNHVDFQIRKGEIRGLIGENGSGKSTVSSIIAGMQPATDGEMFYHGKPWKPKTMLEAAKAGIGMIVQEAGTIDNITVAENIFLGNAADFLKGPFVNRKAMTKAAAKALTDCGIDYINASYPTRLLDMQKRKLVEIAKVMSLNPEILIVDETTTALSQRGRDILYKIMHKLADAGKSVMIISHDMEEMMTHCDVLTILRDGEIIDNLDKQDFEDSKIKKLMVGREIQGNYYRNDNDTWSDEVVLKANYITTLNDLMCFNLELHKGEILGIGGLSDCGMHALGRALYGLDEVIDGEVVLTETNTVVKDSIIAFQHGMGYVSKNRDSESLELMAPVKENIQSTGYWKNIWKKPLIDFKKEKKYVTDQVESLSIKCRDINQPVRFLSGGNKQKVVFGKWIAADSSILILDCPTRGVDVGVKASMYQLMYEMKKQGKAIIMISEELPELIGMSDRLLIMRDAAVSGEFYRKDGLNEHDLINYMI